MARVTRRGDVYYYRAKVPKELRGVLRRVELKFSLGEVDRETAEALALEMSAGQLRLCRALRQAGPMTADQVGRLIAHYMTSFRENREADSIHLGDLTPEVGTDRGRWVSEELAAAEDDLLHNRLSATDRIASDLLRETGTDPAALGEEEFRRLCFRLLGARVDIMREEAKRLPSGLSQGSPSGTHAAAPPSPRLSALVADYLKHRDASAPLPKNTRLEMVAALTVLVDLMGDPPIGSVRAKDAQDFAARYSMLPQRWRSRYKGKTAAEVLKATEGQEVTRSAPGTVKKEQALIKAFWGWACIREELGRNVEELGRNVMEAVKPPDTGRAKDKRHPFNDAEIDAMRPLIEAQRSHRPERYWVALLVAYTGARLEEVAQLRKRDVTEIEGVWCIRIRDEAGSVKSESSERDLPIHSRVLALGFLKYVQAAKGVRLFGDDERDGKVGGPISKWFAWELDKLKLSDRAKKGMHSFRHTMRDKLRRAGVEGVTRREILGHAHEDVEDAVYGDPTGIKERQAALEKVSLPL